MTTKKQSVLTQLDLLQQVYDRIPIHIYFKNTHFEYLACNSLQAIDAGLTSPKDIVGKTDYDLYPKSFADQIRRNDMEVLLCGKPCIFDENVSDLSTENPIYLTHKIPLFNNKGEIIGLAGVSLNITARKLKEDKAELAKEVAEITLAGILKNLPGHVYWKNRDSVYQGCNLAQAKSAGFSTPAEMIGKTDNEMPWSHEASILRESDLTVMKSKKTLTREEASQLANSDHVSIFLSKKSPLFNANGEVIGVLGISFDITDRKEMEKKLNQAKEAAEAANQAKTEFLENMRHDIRTPLTGIVGFSEILKMEFDDPRIKEYAENLVASSQALLHLLDEILEAIRVSTGEIPKLKKKFNLRKTLEDIINLNRAKAAQKQLKLVFDFDSNIPRFVIGDKIRIHRIMLELLANALNFTDSGFVKLSAKFSKRNYRELIIKFIIEDSGIGIPKDKQQEIYIQFKRLTPSYQGIYKGAGLGLSVIKQFIDDLGGEIYVKSETGKGSRFVCIVPLQEALLDDEEGIEEEFEQSIDKPYETTFAQQLNQKLEHSEPQKEHHILVVEDNAIAQKVAKSILGQFNCSADIAESGRAAIDLWKNNSYDLIFMDIGLPDMDGYEVTHRIRVQELVKKTHIPIIALTAHAGDENKKRCIEAGMNAVLSKPLTRQNCVDILESFIPSRCKEEKGIPAPINSAGLPEKEEDLFNLSGFSLLDVNDGIKTMGSEVVLREMLKALIHESLKEDLAKACQYLERYWKTGQRALLEPLYQQILTVVEESTQAIEQFLDVN